MFQGYIRQKVAVYVDHDPAADDYLPLFIAPAAVEIHQVKAVTANDVAASTVNYFDVALVNGGTAGTATTLISGTIGGTAGWTGLTPKTFSLTAGSEELAANEVLTLKYNEEGTGTFAAMLVDIDFVYGKG